MAWFLRPKKNIAENVDKGSSIPDGTWMKCSQCDSVVLSKEIRENLNVCTQCVQHFPLPAKDRVLSLVNKGSFIPWDEKMTTKDILSFLGPKPYSQKIEETLKKSKLKEAVLCGEGLIGSHSVVLCVMDTSYIMGSLGTVVGEKITRAIERATEKSIPLVIISSSGGARMQEGIFSLMQMAKTVMALERFLARKLVYISVLAHPTLGGVTASYASLGDIIIAEPGALIGFAGPRVIEQTIKQTLPEGFQQAEFLLQHGFIDRIVPRHNLRNDLMQIFSLLQ